MSEYNCPRCGRLCIDEFCTTCIENYPFRTPAKLMTRLERTEEMNELRTILYMPINMHKERFDKLAKYTNDWESDFGHGSRKTTR